MSRIQRFTRELSQRLQRRMPANVPAVLTQRDRSEQGLPEHVRARNITRLAILLILAGLAGLAFYIYMLVQTPVWQ